MTREVTFDTICVLLEEHVESSIEMVSELIVDMLGVLGDDLLDDMEPPQGLRRWLESHGFSLVATREPTPATVWAAIDGEEEEDNDLGEEEPDPFASAPPQVGSYVEYNTAPSGPRGQSYVGSGQVTAIAMDGTIVVSPGPGQEIYIDTRVDFIRPVRLPPAL